MLYTSLQTKRLHASAEEGPRKMPSRLSRRVCLNNCHARRMCQSIQKQRVSVPESHVLSKRYRVRYKEVFACFSSVGLPCTVPMRAGRPSAMYKNSYQVIANWRRSLPCSQCCMQSCMNQCMKTFTQPTINLVRLGMTTEG